MAGECAVDPAPIRGRMSGMARSGWGSRSTWDGAGIFWLAWITLLFSCSSESASSGSPSTRSISEAAGESSADSTAPSTAGAGAIQLDTPDWNRVKVAFSTLSTIAGKGASDNGNEWRAEFEGGAAIAAELSRPHMAMADAAGNVYIADKESHGIRKVTVDGTIHTVAGINASGNAPDLETAATEAALSNPNGLWVRSDGTFYVFDSGNAKIRRVSTSGSMTTLITLTSAAEGRGLWVADDESEALIAAGSELKHWSHTGGLQTLADGFVSLGMVLKTAQGRVLAGDRGGMRVYEVALDGTKTVLAGNGSSGKFVDGMRATEAAFDEPRALWPYGDGLLVGLHNGCMILYIDNQGYAHAMLRGSSNTHGGNGQPYSPTPSTIGEMRSLSVTPSGDLLFVENDVGYVRKIAAAR